MNEAVYWAGFFDGEGCVMITKEHNKDGFHINPNFILMINVTNTNKKIMEKLVSFAGCSNLAERKFNDPNKKNAFYFTVRGNQAMNFLEKICPYSKLKKEQIRTAIEFQKNKKIHCPLTKEDLEYRMDTRNKIRALNNVDSNKGRYHNQEEKLIEEKM